MLEGEALAFVSGRDDPVTLLLPVALPASLPVALPLPPVPGTTLDEPKPFSERSADAGVGVLLVCEPAAPEAAPSPSPSPILLGRAPVRLGAASTRA